MESLTGTQDVDKLILLNLDDESLSNAALVSSYVNSLMDELFWAFKFEQKYGVILWKYGVSHRDIYREFSKLQGEKLVKRAIDYDFLELVELLLESYNKTKLLEYAAREGHLKVVELLLSKGADMHDNNDAVLRWAAKNGHLKVVKLLLDSGADIHAANNGALQLAAEYGHLEVVELLLNKGANIHAKDDNALRLAAGKGHLEVVKLLLQRGANNPASSYGHSDIIKLLNRESNMGNEHSIKKSTNQCQGVTKTGNSCKRMVKVGLYCSIHKK